MTLRSIAWLLVPFLLAGCASSPDPVEPAAAGEAASPLGAPSPFSTSGEVFLPPSSGSARVETLVAFAVNASGMGGSITLHLGNRMGFELPASIADVEVEVRDPAGEPIATAHLQAPAFDATLALADLVAGEHALALLSYGGSDGAANGDYVAFALEIA